MVLGVPTDCYVEFHRRASRLKFNQREGNVYRQITQLFRFRSILHAADVHSILKICGYLAMTDLAITKYCCVDCE